MERKEGDKRGMIATYVLMQCDSFGRGHEHCKSNMRNTFQLEKEMQYVFQLIHVNC